MGLGVPGSEKLVRVVQLLLILCYIPPEQKAWRWRCFGMPFFKNIIVINTSILLSGPVLVVFLYQYAFFPAAPRSWLSCPSCR
jgi:hypothetical protein